MTRTLPIVLMFAAIATPVHAQCDQWLAGPIEQAEPGVQGGQPYPSEVTAAITWDPDGAGPLPTHLVVAGSFKEIHGIRANNVAAWTGDHWAPLGDGIVGAVADLAVYNGELIACGPMVGIVARWHLGAWVPFGFPLGGAGDQHVISLEVYSGQLVIAGRFTSIAGVVANNIARWNGATWQPLGPGLLGGSFPAVYDLTVYNGELIAGGVFTIAGLGSAYNIARWNGVEWQPLGGGTSAAVGVPTVYALGLYNGELIAGGRFTQAGTVAANRIARWNGSVWQPLGTGIQGGSGGVSAPSVRALCAFNGSLIVGGDFSSAGLVAIDSIAGWNGSSWFALGTGLHDPQFPRVSALTAYATRVIVGGQFTYAGAVPANHLARWSGSEWSAFQVPWFVYSLAQFGSRIIAAGNFAQSTGTTTPAAYNVGAWDGASFKPLGGGLNDGARALKAFTQPGPTGARELVCGGEFTMAGGLAANRIARWVEDPVIAFPPPAWQPMGAGFNNAVYALERYNGVTFAGGAFTASGATSLGGIARWNGSAWEGVGTGTNGLVFAFGVLPALLPGQSPDLIVAGNFTVAGGNAANRIARWRDSGINPPTWLTMGAGFNAPVRAIERHENSTYAGGEFTMSGATTVNRVARWTGSAWVPVGSGFTGTVYALKSHAGAFYGGGAFTTSAGSVANGIARWNGTSWTQVLSGVDSSVFALAPFQGELHLGGAFSHFQFPTTESRGWARYNLTGAPAIAFHPGLQNIDCGQDAHFTVQPALGYSGHAYA